MASIGLLKDKHDKELLKNTQELKVYYEEILSESNIKVDKLEQEVQFFEEELQNTNKRLFDLMKYKMTFEEAQEAARKNLEQEFIESADQSARRQEEKLMEQRNEIELLRKSYECRIQESKEERDRETEEYKKELLDQKKLREKELKALEDYYKPLLSEVF